MFRSQDSSLGFGMLPAGLREGFEGSITGVTGFRLAVLAPGCRVAAEGVDDTPGE